MLRARIFVALAMAWALGVAAAASKTSLPEAAEVQLSQGTVEGVRESIGESRFFYSFTGIPYAAPPVGEFRFKEPAPAASWSGVRKSFNHPACPQVNIVALFENRTEFFGEEDCLYLNVFTPLPHKVRLPVMVFIHGGGFVLGDVRMFGGSPRPLLTKDIILVTIQYRLGTLGFLSTGDSVLPGNLGLKDQTFALQWVHDNIRHFGGNPDMITIFGESAGSASVDFQMLTPYSKGLFHRAIMQSGSAISPWALRYDHAHRALELAKGFNCPGAEDSSADSNQLLQCFKERSVEELVVAAIKDTVMMLPFYMVPRTDGDYLPDDPTKLLREGKYHGVDIISGVCQNEAAESILRIAANETVKASLLGNKEAVSVMLMLDQEEKAAYLTQRSFYHYTGEFDITDDNAEKAEKLFSDRSMSVGHDETTSFHARGTAYGKHTYRYEVQHRPRGPFPLLSKRTIKSSENWVAHGDDLRFLFDEVYGAPMGNHNDDVFLSDIMVDLWTNFAKTGDPTPDLELGFKWEAMESEHDLRYLSLTPSPRMRDDNRAQSREFWRNMPVRMSKELYPDRFA